MHPIQYDLVVIGSGPAGQKGAIAAAKLGKRVAMVDRNDMVGGVCIHGGTVPSKTLREAILHLTGFRHRSFYGNDYVVKDRISIRDLAARVSQVVERETGVVRDQLRRNGIDLLCGTAQFLDRQHHRSARRYRSAHASRQPRSDRLRHAAFSSR